MIFDRIFWVIYSIDVFEIIKVTLLKNDQARLAMDDRAKFHFPLTSN